jgi:hypothetical protein
MPPELIRQQAAVGVHQGQQGCGRGAADLQPAANREEHGGNHSEFSALHVGA